MTWITSSEAARLYHVRISVLAGAATAGHITRRRMPGTERRYRAAYEYVREELDAWIPIWRETNGLVALRHQETQQRDCLDCGRSFKSTGRGNRICGACGLRHERVQMADGNWIYTVEGWE